MSTKDPGKSPAPRSWKRDPKAFQPTSEPRWKHGGPAPFVAPGRWWRRLKILIAGGLVVALGAALIIYLWPRRITPLITVALTDYRTPLPPNAFAKEDVDRLNLLDGGDARTGRNLRIYPSSKPWTTPEDALEELERQLSQVKADDLGTRLSMVYLSAHGVQRADGEPCLVLPGGGVAPGTNPDEWLPMRDVVRQLHKSGGGVKLLILDANRQAENWSLGMLYNGFAPALADVLDELRRAEGIDDVVILNSTSGGQVGWRLPPRWKGTAFGRFVARGLQGLDDAPGDDQWVTIGELAAYVRREVSQWVSANRFDVQEPILLPTNTPHAALQIVYGAGDELPDDPQEAPAAPEEEAKYWELHSRLAPWGAQRGLDGPHARRLALTWEKFQLALMDWERLAGAGEAYAEAAADRAAELFQLEAQLRQPGPTTQMRSPSLALAQAWGQQAATPSEQAQIEKALADATDKLLPAAEKLPHAVRATAAWKWLLDQNIASLDDAAWLRLLKFVGRPEKANDSICVEWQLVRLLTGRDLPNLPDKVWEERGKTVKEALELFRLSQQAAAPADERAHYFVRRLVEEADVQRRRAEDALFIGQPDEAAAGRAQALYENAEKAARLASRALQLRDRASAELPHLAAWIARRPSQYLSADELTRQLDKREPMLAALKELAIATHELSRELDDGLTASMDVDGGSQWQAPIEREAKVAEDRLAVLHTALEAEVRRQREAPLVSSSLREIDDLLAVPLVTGENRLELLTHRRDIEKLMSASAAGVAEDEPGSGSEFLFLSRMASWRPHPALAIWQSAATDGDAQAAAQAMESPEAIRSLCRTGGQVRTLFLAEWQKGEELAENTAAEGGARSHADARRGLASADRSFRASSPFALPLLTASSFELAENNLAALDRLDRAHLLVWQGQRALADFWASGLESEATPYYARVVQRALDDAARPLRSIGSNAHDGLQKELAARPADGAEIVGAAADKLTLRSDDAPQPVFQHRATISRTANLPAGQAAIFALAPNGLVGGLQHGPAGEFSSRLPLDVQGPAKEELTFGFQSPAGDSSGLEWRLVSFFRGHVNQHPFQVIPPEGGLELVVRPAEPADTRISVVGSETRPGTVAIILDCSGSMAQRRANGTWNYDRMDRAKEAVETAFTELARSEKYRAGLWLYGHRRHTGGGWNESKWGPLKRDVTIDNDIQEVVGVQRLSTQTLPGFVAEVTKTQPTGGTPLYDAIERAVNETLSKEPAEFPRQLVVITDGDNEHGSDTAAGMLAAFQRHPGIRLLVVGCGLGESPKFRDPVQQVGGDYIPAQDLTTLKQKLTEALGIYNFKVEELQSNNRRVQVGAANINQLVPVPPQARRLEVSVPGEAAKRPLFAEGGEFFQLVLEKRGNVVSLSHKRFGEADDESENFADGLMNPLFEEGSLLDPERLYIAWHRPQAEGGYVRFPISFQNDDPASFSPRPAETWVEIRPLGGKSDEFPYYYYDLPFEPNQPVPVIRCEAPQWPPDAREAELIVVCKSRRTAARLHPQINQVRSNNGQPHPDLTLAGPNGGKVEFSVGVADAPGGKGAYIRVAEEHSDQQIGTYPVRVAVSSLTRPDRIVHEYRHKFGVVIHTFWYEGANAKEDLLGHVLEITPKEDLLQDAIRPPGPLTASGFR